MKTTALILGTIGLGLENTLATFGILIVMGIIVYIDYQNEQR